MSRAPSSRGRRRSPWRSAGYPCRWRRGSSSGSSGPTAPERPRRSRYSRRCCRPTSGLRDILGLDINRDIYEIRRRIGIVFGGERGLYNRVTAVENLRYFADLYGVPPPRRSAERVTKMVKLVGLEGRENERVEKYSRGMKQRLHIAKALIHDPELVFLDEPTIGLDPGGARDIRNMVREMKQGGEDRSS